MILKVYTLNGRTLFRVHICAVCSTPVHHEATDCPRCGEVLSGRTVLHVDIGSEGAGS